MTGVFSTWRQASAALLLIMLRRPLPELAAHVPRRDRLRNLLAVTQQTEAARRGPDRRSNRSYARLPTAARLQQPAGAAG